MCLARDGCWGESPGPAMCKAAPCLLSCLSSPQSVGFCVVTVLRVGPLHLHHLLTPLVIRLCFIFGGAHPAVVLDPPPLMQVISNSPQVCPCPLWFHCWARV